MSDISGSMSHLLMMAERCRRAAQELRGEDAQHLVDLAERCERRVAERRRAEEFIAAED